MKAFTLILAVLLFTLSSEAQYAPRNGAPGSNQDLLKSNRIDRGGADVKSKGLLKFVKRSNAPGQNNDPIADTRQVGNIIDVNRSTAIRGTVSWGNASAISNRFLGTDRYDNLTASFRLSVVGAPQTEAGKGLFGFFNKNKGVGASYDVQMVFKTTTQLPK